MRQRVSFGLSFAPAAGLALALSLGTALGVAGCRQAEAAPHGASVQAGALSAAKGHAVRWDFEDVAVGTLPAGWKVEETNPRGAHADWRVTQQEGAPSGRRALTLTDAKGHSGSTFNLCWTDEVSFQDGTIEVHFRAGTGREDQGGGLAWRVQDKDDYYVARFNPLEDNFRLYTVQGGRRRMLKTATVKLAAGAWHAMKIVQRGAHFEAYLDGTRWLEGEDTRFPKAGGVGLWTKADAATSFDDLVVTPATPAKPAK